MVARISKAALEAKRASAIATLEADSFSFGLSGAMAVASLQAALSAGVAQDTCRAAVVAAAMAGRLAFKEPPADAAAKSALISRCRVLSDKAKTAGAGATKTELPKRTVEQETAYAAARQVWSRLLSAAQAKPKGGKREGAGAKRKMEASAKLTPLGVVQKDGSIAAPKLSNEQVPDYARQIVALLHMALSKNAGMSPVWFNAFTEAQAALKAPLAK